MRGEPAGAGETRPTWRRPLRHPLLWASSVVVVGLIAVLAVAWPHGPGFISGAAPDQFRRELDPSLVQDYPDVLGIAHNAGNSLEATRTALAHHADVIEVDLISVGGHLVAGRTQPLQWLSNHLFRGPTLSEVWDATATASATKLDLKQDDRPFLDDLVSFLSERQHQRKVMISTRDAAALLYLRPRLLDVSLLFTLAFPEAVDQLRSDPKLLASTDGVSVFQGLVTAPLVRWLHAHHMLALAWTVNDVQGLNAVVRAGVDGVTTANLAILEVLG